MAMVAASDLRGRGRAGIVAVVNLGALALNVTLNLLLLPTMGFVGAAVAALATSVMQSIVLTQVVIAATGVTYRRILEPTARDLQMLRAIGQQLW
jgi:Na+-driven multidrug efflux pump